jgi:hypothetical protein
VTLALPQWFQRSLFPSLQNLHMQVGLSDEKSGLVQALHFRHGAIAKEAVVAPSVRAAAYAFTIQCSRRGTGRNGKGCGTSWRR